MKKLNIFIFFLIAAIHSNVSAQDTVLNNKWSTTISFSPITTFYYYHPQNEFEKHYSKGVRELIYPIGFNFEIARKLNDRLTISSGFNFKSRPNDNMIIIIGEWTGSYNEESTDNRYIFELPIDLRYTVSQKSRIFNPFISTGLRSSYFKRYYVGEYTRWDFSGKTEGTIDNHDGKLILFYEIGAGSYVKIYRSLSLMIGSNLTYSFSGFGFLEFQSGLNFSFK